MARKEWLQRLAQQERLPMGKEFLNFLIWVTEYSESALLASIITDTNITRRRLAYPWSMAIHDNLDFILTNGV